MSREIQLPHVVIRASAGTGKTYALSNRYLKLLLMGAPPDSILATTFTRKAAGEILERVMTRLALAAGDETAAAKLAGELGLPGVDQARCREAMARLCGSLHRVAVCTIDSFFNRVVMSFRHELGVQGNVKVVGEDDPAAARLRMQAIDALLAEEADKDVQTLVDLLRRLHHGTTQRTVTGAIDRIVKGFYGVYLQAPGQGAWRALPAAGAELSRVELAEQIVRLGGLAERMPDRKWAEALRKNREQAQQNRWKDFLSGGLAKAVALGLGTYYSRPISDEVLEVFGVLVGHAKAALLGRLAQRTLAVWELLERFDGHYARLRRRHGVMLFSDLSRKLARELPGLGEDVLLRVYFRLDARVSHLLLDEFQDTSLEQWDILRPMAEEVCSHADGSHSFFCVGDVKQAIYGWRGGCAELMEDVERKLRIPEEGRRNIVKSYRSSPVVLGAVNRVFGTIENSPVLTAEHARTAAEWRKGFLDHRANDPDKPGYVELVSSRAGAEDDSADEGAESDGDEAGGEEADRPGDQVHREFVVERIKEIVKRLPGCSVGVLVGTNNEVRLLVAALRSAGMDASGEGGNPITDDAAVGAVLSAMTLADHPGDSVAAYHVANSPVGAVVGLTSGRGDRAAAAAAIRRSLVEDGYAGTIGRWARDLAGSCNERGVRRLEQLVELAQRYDPEQVLRPGRFVEFVKATGVEEPSRAAVRVMTVYKAKGLEFDVVVLPALDRPSNRLMGNVKKDGVYVVRTGPTGPVAAVYSAVAKEVRALSPELTAAYEQERARRLKDDMSVLYVAMTRARYALHMIVKPLVLNDKGKPGTRGWTNLSEAAVVRRALRPADFQERAEGEQVLWSDGDVDWYGRVRADFAGGAETKARTSQSEPVRVELAADSGGASRSWRRVSPSSLEGVGRVSAGDLLAVEQGGSKLRGTVIHGWLAQIDWLDGSHFLPDDRVMLGAAQRAVPGVDDQLLVEWLAELKRMVRVGGVTAAFARLAGEVELWREQPFAVRSGNELVVGAFDRVVVEKSGGQVIGAHLWDFKTDSAGGDEAKLAGLIEKYRPQVRAYRAALSGMLGLESERVDCRLVFLDSGKVRLVE